MSLNMLETSIRCLKIFEDQTSERANYLQVEFFHDMLVYWKSEKGGNDPEINAEWSGHLV